MLPRPAPETTETILMEGATTSRRWEAFLVRSVTPEKLRIGQALSENLVPARLSSDRTENLRLPGASGQGTGRYHTGTTKRPYFLMMWSLTSDDR